MAASRTLALRRQDGQGLVELIVALTILAVGVGALLTVLTSSALSLQRSDRKGTALTLAEKQIELYRNLNWSDIRLDDASFASISASDPYMTAYLSDPTIPSGAKTSQVTDTTVGTDPCDDVSPPPECMPIQTVTDANSPDHRSYRIDTYVVASTPMSGATPIGDPVRTVTVVVRDAAVSTLPILAQSSSNFSSVNISNQTGKTITKLALTAPKADLTGTPVGAGQITATLTGVSNQTGTLTFFVSKQSSPPSPPCTGAAWTQVGTAAVDPSTTVYNPSGGYTPTTAGTYYWYVAYSGDANNNQAISKCSSTMAHTTVQASQWTPSLAVTAPANGVVNTQIPATSVTASVLSSSGYMTAAITFKVFKSAAAPASCAGSGFWSATVSPSGDGSWNPNIPMTPDATPGTYWWYATYPGDLTNTAASSVCGSSMPKTVVTMPPDTFSFSNIAAQTAGSQFTATITAQLYSGGTDTSYTGTKTLTFSGPSKSPNANSPTYPATVTFVNGIATNVAFKLYDAEPTKLTAVDGIITGDSNSFTVSAAATSAFALVNPGAQNAGTAFGVTVDAVDAYGNPSSYSGAHTLAWSGPGNSPKGNAPSYPSTATSVTFTNGVAVPTGIVLYNASGTTTLTATEGAKTGTSSSFVVNALTPVRMAFVNCSLPTAANTTCAGSPFSTGNNGTLKGNVQVQDTYGNATGSPVAVSISMSTSNAANYTVTTPLTISLGSATSDQFTVTPAKNNPALTTITAHVVTGGSYSDITLRVKK